MAVEQIGYPAWNNFPVTGPNTSPARQISTTTGGARITLTGTTFSVRVQISNAQAVNAPAHLFTPAENQWETWAEVTQPDAPLDIPAPARWVRLILDSGTVTGGNVEESTRTLPNAQIALQAAGAIGNTVLTQLASKDASAGPQFVDGSRWLWQSGGTANGGTIVAGLAGFWKRERTAKTWNAADFTAYVTTSLAGNWGAGLTHVISLMADNDTLLIPPGLYTTTSPVNCPTPINWDARGAILDVNHGGIGIDMLPGGLHDNGGVRKTMGYGPYGIEATYRGTLPRVIKRYELRVRGSGTGVRLVNAFYPALDLSEGIQGFETGFLLYASNAAVDSTGFAAVTYGEFRLGRMENAVNVQAYFENAPNTFITDCTFYEGSFSSHTFTGDVQTNTHHVYIDGGPTAGRCDNLIFIRPRFEGHTESGFTATGKAERLSVIRGRMEMDAGLYAVNLNPDVSGCRLDLAASAAFVADGRIRDLGKNNEVTDSGYPSGNFRYLNGISTITGKFIDWAAPANWRPEALDLEPVKEFNWNNGDPAITIDLKKYRRVQVNALMPAGGTGIIPNNLVVFTNPPTGDYEYEVTLVQGGLSAPSAIGADWMGTVYYSGQAQPVKRQFGQDTYRVKVRPLNMTPTRFVLDHLYT